MRTIAILLVLLLAGVSQAQTNVGSITISGTVRWTKAMSPISFGSVRIGGGTLIIDAGVELIGSSTSSGIQTISGSYSKLQIQGTEAEPVTMRPAIGVPYIFGVGGSITSSRSIVEISNFMLTNGTIHLEAHDCVLTNCNVVGQKTLGTSTTYNGGIKVRRASTGIISNCFVRGQQVGFDLTGASVVATDCRAELNDTAIVLRVGSSASFDLLNQ